MDREPFPAWPVHDGDVGTPVMTCRCVGFDAPFDKEFLIKLKNRALPFKMRLFDQYGVEFTNTSITPPMIEIDLTPITPNDNISAAPPEAWESVGKGGDGNQFTYNGTKWILKLKTEDFSTPGKYTATVVSGDPKSYLVIPTCTATFSILPADPVGK